MQIDVENYKKIIKKLDKNYSHLTPVQKKISNYIIYNINEASFLNADELSSKLNTTPSSVVRFCKRIGYTGYPELQKELRKFVLAKLNSYNPAIKAKKVSTQNSGTITSSSLLIEIDNIKELMKPKSKIEKKIDYFSNEIINSKRTYIVANRASFGIAHTLWYYCKKTIRDIYLLNDFDGAVFDYLKEIDKHCLLISISFPDYSRITIDFCEYAKKKGAKIISITDKQDSPLCKFSACCINTPVSTLGYHTSRVAAAALINAIINKLFVLKREITIKNLEEDNIIKEKFY
ncbi:MAG: MurR/RpiR family transcriptional regulator [Eubacteriaceae bacterium]